MILVKHNNRKKLYGVVVDDEYNVVDIDQPQKWKLKKLFLLMNKMSFILVKHNKRKKLNGVVVVKQVTTLPMNSFILWIECCRCWWI